MPEHVAADIGDHALAEPVHEIEPGGARQSEDDADADQRAEIGVDQVGLDAGEAEIDHAPDRQRHGQRRRRRDDERHEGPDDHRFMAEQIRPESQQRTQRDALALFLF